MVTLFRRRTVAAALLPVASAVLVGASSAMAGGGGWTPPVTLRTAPVGRAIAVNDVGSKSDNLAIVWQESDASDGGDPRIRLKISQDGGASFMASQLVDDRDSIDARSDVCAGHAWVTYSLHTPADDPGVWHAVLSGFDLDDGELGPAGLLSDPFSDPDAHFVDVACIGERRHIVAWVEERGFTDDIFIEFHAIFPSMIDPPPHYEYGPFDGHSNGGVAVAATGSRAYAAWVRINTDTGEETVRFKRYNVGPGPDSIVTPHATQSPVDHFTGSSDVHLAASGAKVILFWVHNGDVWARRSTNGGASFAPKVKIGNFPPDYFTDIISVDMRNSRVIVEAVGLYGDFSGGSIDPWRITSENSGVSWDVDPVSGAGARAAGFMRIDGETLAAEARDRRYSEQPDTLRFSRED